MNLENSTDRSKLVILAAVGLFYSVGIAYLLPNLPNQLYGNDFFARWYASRMLLTSGRSLYDWTNAYELAKITGWHQVYDFRYYYPANLLFFTGPLSFLPYKLALFIWTVFGLWCLWLSITIFARLLKNGLSINRFTILLALLTTSVPVLQHTVYAQFNSLVALALALTYYALCRRKYFLAGLCAGGMLFKPQVAVITLVVFLIWTGLARERRSFWAGLVLIVIPLWAGPELLEPNWVVTFVQSLSSYPAVLSVVDRVWNPYQIVSLGFMLITGWSAVRLRRYPAHSIQFSALLAWTICLTALIIPIFGMLNIVLMGPVFVILLNGFAAFYPAYLRWVWFGMIGFFVAGLLAFVMPLFLNGATGGMHINAAEVVYRFTMPVVLGLLTWPLILHPVDIYHPNSQLAEQLSPVN
jgi:hypothetical protein